MHSGMRTTAFLVTRAIDNKRVVTGGLLTAQQAYCLAFAPDSRNSRKCAKFRLLFADCMLMMTELVLILNVCRGWYLSCVVLPVCVLWEERETVRRVLGRSIAVNVIYWTTFLFCVAGGWT